MAYCQTLLRPFTTVPTAECVEKEPVFTVARSTKWGRPQMCWETRAEPLKVRLLGRGGGWEEEQVVGGGKGEKPVVVSNLLNN